MAWADLFGNPGPRVRRKDDTRRSRAPQWGKVAMPKHPLTHHEIIGLIAPFTRRGIHLDMAATDRAERRMVFKPIEHGPGPEPALESPPTAPADTPPAEPVEVTPAPARPSERLEMENPRREVCRLTRVVTLTQNLEARLVTEGPDPEELLRRIDSVPLDRQIRPGRDYVIAQSHRLEPVEGGGADTSAGLRLVLTRAAAGVAGFTLKLKMPEVKGYYADIEIVPPAGEEVALPDDLLAVLGWDWSRLDRYKGAWRGRLKPRGREPDCSRRAEAMLEQAAAHLARTLAEPPAMFHQRLSRRRWAVAFRRAVPLIVSVVLLVGSLGIVKLDLAPESGAWMLIFNAPPLLLVAFFCMREVPRIELPARPRSSTAASWRQAPPAPAIPAPVASPQDASSA